MNLSGKAGLPERSFGNVWFPYPIRFLPNMMESKFANLVALVEDTTRTVVMQLSVGCVKSCEEKKITKKKEIFELPDIERKVLTVGILILRPGSPFSYLGRLHLICMRFKGLWLLGTLPDTWETFRTSLSNSAPDGVITMELAKGSILNEETRRKSQGSSSQSDVLVTERRGRSQSRGPSNRGNHRSSSSKGKFADVEFWTPGLELVLYNVKHVPDMRLNIISTGLLDEDGYHNSSGKQTRFAFKSRSPLRMENILDLFGDDIQNDQEQGADDVDAKEQPNLDEDVHPELPVPDMPPFLLLRRSTRDHHPSTRYSAHEYIYLPMGESLSVMQKLWKMNTKKEWLPKGKRDLKNKWVYKLKTEEHTSRPRYKARLVVKGFSQKRGIDFDKIFSPVVKMGSIRVVLGLTASLDLGRWKLMDVKTTFLHGDLDKEIYMEQPEGFQVKGKEDYVCRLQKSLYGLKQAPRQWYKKFESVIGKQGYRKTSSDHCVFFQKFGDDDFIILLGASKTYHWLRIFLCDRGAKKLHISQEQYIEKVLCRFNMDKAKVVSPLCRIQNLAHFEVVVVSRSCQSGKKCIGKLLNGYLDICEGDCIEDGMFELNKVHTDDNASDMLTKAVAREKLKVCCSIAGMANSSS
ncbi:putative RNA-directed DNA polymerase [Tanacetum coccineum]|uniref:RNA-directed DNA polymerase n=1 Tax=Tanacetum coccineum TaxID=301880 RepID=A0ABQ5B698_9ASTR